jgi:hypothetical protein
MIATFSSEAATWVQAVGTIAAVVGAGWVAAAESRASRRREDRIEQESQRREERLIASAKTAALNLAILAATQIHDLHVLLRDEARRGRVARVSPSRTLLATESLLIAYPIQTLSEAAPMVAFAYFPGALATAAEVYANLEVSIRASQVGEAGRIFGEYAEQMAQLDEAAKRHLRDLKAALALDSQAPAPVDSPAPQAHQAAPPMAA